MFCLAASAATVSTAQPRCNIPGGAAFIASGGDPDSLQIDAGEADISETGDMRLRGGVELNYADRRLRADELEYERASQRFSSRGDVRYEDANLVISANAANVSADERAGTFEDATFELRDGNARGGASSIELSQAKGMQLRDVEYSTCPRGDNGWLLRAGQIRIDPKTEQGSARNVMLRFKGVPFLYLPYLGFPAGTQRQTGLLTPRFGSTSTSGLELSWPWYWNIAPNYDATITPRFLSERGLQAQAEFRYLQTHHRGQIVGDYLNDTRAGQDRYRWRLDHLSANGTWLAAFDVHQTGDRAYFDDLGQSQDSVSSQFLSRSGALRWDSGPWSIGLDAQEYDLLGRAAIVNPDPFGRLPALSAQYQQRLGSGALGLQINGAGKLARYASDVGDDIWRAHIDPTIGLEFRQPGWYLRPEASWMYTRYRQSDRDDLNRDLPRLSLDSGLFFDRIEASRQHTIELTGKYLYIPFRDQAALPIIDTGLPDFALPWLFADNRYTGPDRIGDSNSFTLAASYQLREAGRDILTTTIGRRYDIEQTRVQVPGEPGGQRHSDILAAAQFLLSEHWRLNADAAFSRQRNELSRSTADLHWAHTGRRITLGWRQRTGLFEQARLAFVLPLGNRWRTAGGMQYSLRDDSILETYFAFEYQSCCWATRIAARRYIRADGEPDTSIQVQLELSGLGSLGDSFDEVLDSELSSTWRY